MNEAIRIVLRVFHEGGVEEERLAEASTVLWRAFEERRYDRHGSIRGYFYGILRKLEFGSRKPHAETLVEGALENIPSPEPTPEEAFEIGLREEATSLVDVKRLMRELIRERVPLRHQRLAMLRFVEGRKPAEILQVLTRETANSGLDIEWVRCALQNIRRNYLRFW